jgi:predicted unusual protein kinase regulating ubiquinone biosynthesis (AarF/ABC1/UbiB family)
VVNLRAYRRFFVVARQFLPLLLAYARDRRRFLLFGGRRQVDSETRRRRARALLSSMLTLGPTFIKLGQLLSTRPDVLPPEYVEEFEDLQDNVPPAPWEGAKRVLEEDLGPVEERFVDFDTDAISGASLGQVYTAKVDGQDVAVKIRRPGVEELVEADLRVIRFSLPILMQFVDDARSFSLETLADEFDKTIREEMDYERERRMLADIKANFADDPKIRIPDVLESHSTGRVLTMEYVPGTKINRIEDLDALGVDRTELARRLQEAYLQMLIVDGSFHADPHPGNLAVQDDGTLVFYDFGMSGRVDEFVQGKIVQFYGAVARQDIDAILDTLVELGTLSPDADRQLMSDIMELAIQDARGEDIEQYRVNQIVSQVEDTIYEFPLRLPPNMALVLRVATVVEGVCVTLDPDFDFIDVATDYLRDHGFIERGVRDYVEERAEALQESTRAALRTPPKLEEALDRINRESLTLDANIVDEERVIDRLARRIILGLLLTGTVVSTAILWAFSDPLAAGASLGSAIVVLGLLYRSFRRRRGIRATPQFTRQNLRQRREE